MVIITEGRFVDKQLVIEASEKLKNECTYVYAVAVGASPDVATLRSIVSHDANNNIFMTSSYDALRAHLRAVTNTVCEGK